MSRLRCWTEDVEKKLNWYVGFTRSCQEKKVAEAMQILGVEHYLPIQKVQRVWRDRLKVIDKMVIPRMVFVHTYEEKRIKLLLPYQVNQKLMDMAKPTAIFMHCLPSFHDFDTTMAKSQMELGYDIREVTDDVFLSPQSKVFDEAENRMHTIKAVMVATIGNV